MRVALLKDPEIRARIERPMPLPDGPETEEGDVGASDAPVAETPMDPEG
jgi:penicillin-binding protein 2